MNRPAVAKRSAGATRGNTRGGLGLYLRLHAQTFVGSLGRLWRQPFAALMTIVVIGVALAMPVILQLLVVNAKAATGTWDSAVDLSVYLQPGVAKDVAAELAKKIGARADVADVTLIDADTALADFKAQSGFGDALEALDDNPLPTTLIIRPAKPKSDSAALAALADALAAEPNVDLVQFDTQWVKRFHAMLDIVRRGVLLASALLALAVLVIIGNTIRMDIQNRRDEIEIVKLIGGSDGFIRRPFLYSGLWYGLGGGTAAALIVLLVTRLLSQPVANLAGLYGSQFRLISMGASQALTVIAIGGALGWLGSWLAATRHMRRIEPQ